MVSTKKVVIVCHKNSVFMNASRFEAVVPVWNKSEVKKVWDKNKLPIFLEAKNFDNIETIELDGEWEGPERFIAFCHSNGVECGEFLTGNVYDTAKERCILCEISNHKGFKGDLKYYNTHVELEDCIIYESPHFYVVPELGSLKQGFLMIVPKSHILSVAQFPEELMPEYHQVCEDVESILQGAYKSNKIVTFMEHGSGPSGLTSHPKSIVHAHTHVVIDFKIPKKYLRLIKMKEQDISLACRTHYFSYQEGSNGKLLIAMDPEVFVPRQYPRQIMAQQLGYAPNQYNWRNETFSENIVATLYRLHQYLKKEKVNQRIKERTDGFVQGYALRES